MCVQELEMEEEAGTGGQARTTELELEHKREP